MCASGRKGEKCVCERMQRGFEGVCERGRRKEGRVLVEGWLSECERVSGERMLREREKK